MLFATEGEVPDVNGTLPTGVETTPVRLSASLSLPLTPTPTPTPTLTLTLTPTLTPTLTLTLTRTLTLTLTIGGRTDRIPPVLDGVGGAAG